MDILKKSGPEKALTWGSTSLEGLSQPDRALSDS